MSEHVDPRYRLGQVYRVMVTVDVHGLKPREAVHRLDRAVRHLAAEPGIVAGVVHLDAMRPVDRPADPRPMPSVQELIAGVIPGQLELGPGE